MSDRADAAARSPLWAIPILWMLPILVLAVLQVAAGLLGLALQLAGLAVPEAAVNPPWVSALQAAVAGSAGGWLLLAGRRDHRAVALGGVLLLMGSSFAYPLTASLPDAFGGEAGRLVTALRHLPADAFLALFAWTFFASFPRAIASPRVRGGARVATIASALAGLALFAITAARGLPGVDASIAAGRLAAFDRFSITSQYWTVVYGLILPALPLALWRSRTARRGERRRVALFLFGIVAGATPAIVYILLAALVPSFLPWAESSGVRAAVMPVIQLGVLSIPLATAYAVGVERVLPVGVVLRAALRYALARGLLVALAAVPFAWAAWLLVGARDRTIGQVLTGPTLLALLAALAAGVLAHRLRARAMAAVDRRFFREHYDARRILSALIDRSRLSRNAEELADLLGDEIDRALHLESASFFVRDDAGRLAPVRPGPRPLPAQSRLEARLRLESGPWIVDLGDARSSLHELPVDERYWLAEGDRRLLVPLVGSDGRLLALMALGPKKSELPFSREDRQLLADIAAAGALALEAGFVAATGSSAEAEETRPGLECARCGRVTDPADGSVCSSCDGALADSLLPAVLLGKFRIERRLGQGAAGVVYAAEDLALGRRVAIKTLPRVSPEAALQLRREARAMAAVVHPRLALIFGAESWRDTPMLVIEYLAGGTLADRLEVGRLDPPAAVALGIGIADALDCAHREGILHRDVKPSNIGFTDRDAAKLMDFGVAHIVHDVLESPRDGPEPNDGSARETGGLAGTPLYLSPEALAGETPDASFDLWSLALVVYEGLAGANPFERDSLVESMSAIARANAPDLREHRPDCPPALAAFLSDALARDRSRRPGSAREMARRLAGLDGVSRAA